MWITGSIPVLKASLVAKETKNRNIICVAVMMFPSCQLRTP